MKNVLTWVVAIAGIAWVVEPLPTPAGFTISDLHAGRWSATGRTAFTFVSTG